MTSHPQIRLGAAPIIRVANKAIILRDDTLLVNECYDPSDGITYWQMPGGGQDWGEDAVTALERECREELGCDVAVRGFACLRDFIGANHRHPDLAWFHQQENYFFCDLAPGATPRYEPATGDERQVGVRWMAIADLRASGEFSPLALLDWLAQDPVTRPGYLGDVA